MFATFPENGKASEIAAKQFGTNATYIETAKTIADTAPDLIDSIHSGTLAIPVAKVLARLPIDCRTKLLQEANDGKSILAKAWKEADRIAAAQARKANAAKPKFPATP